MSEEIGSNRQLDRTLFQEGQPCDPRYDLRTDAAIAYGIDASLPARVAGWRARGYRVHVMTGLAWGTYQDYVLGHWDGRDHWDEAQRLANGDPKQHGQDMPYMIPTDSYAAYLEELLVRAIDAGVEDVFLEEPEWWAYTGYGPAFERAWFVRYGVPYEDPAGSPAAFTRGAELKYALYGELITRLCTAIKEQERARGRTVHGYVATHSLLNYAHNRIVSPHAALREIADCNGVILQVWSHTARSQTLYEGRQAERMFPVAFLEYASGLELVRGSDRQMWFLADPVEDRPTYGWDRYRAGYQVTVAASLFHPAVSAYEVMPWPSRVFTGRYPRQSNGPPGELIPARYAAELLVVANALRQIPDGPIERQSGTTGIGVLVADSLMFRRDGPAQHDPLLSAFYGLALPPLLAGMPVQPVQMEALATIGAPEDMRLLLLSYDGMTPPTPAAHTWLSEWVRAGNALLCFGAGDGPYERVPGWWNNGEGERGPWSDLFAQLGLSERPAPGLHWVGSGLVLVEPEGPIVLAARADGAALVRAHCRAALEAIGAAVYRESAYLTMRRGAYLIATMLNEGPAAAPLQLAGSYVDLFDGDLPVRHEVTLQQGDCALLIDLERVAAGPRVLAASARIEKMTISPVAVRFQAEGPSDTPCVLRIALPGAPRRVLADETVLEAAWDPTSSTALLRHANRPEGVTFVVEWR